MKLKNDFENAVSKLTSFNCITKDIRIESSHFQQCYSVVVVRFGTLISELSVVLSQHLRRFSKCCNCVGNVRDQKMSATLHQKTHSKLCSLPEKKWLVKQFGKISNNENSLFRHGFGWAGGISFGSGFRSGDIPWKVIVITKLTVVHLKKKWIYCSVVDGAAVPLVDEAASSMISLWAVVLKNCEVKNG